MRSSDVVMCGWEVECDVMLYVLSVLIHWELCFMVLTSFCCCFQWRGGSVVLPPGFS